MTPADLRAWRAEMGLTQSAAADLLGYTRPHYALLESGAAPIMPGALALACAAAYRRLKPWPQTVNK